MSGVMDGVVGANTRESISAAVGGSGCDAYARHETDDISDILDAGLGGLHSLAISAHPSRLSASAVEFTPGSLRHEEAGMGNGGFPLADDTGIGREAHNFEDEQRPQQHEQQDGWGEIDEDASALGGQDDTYYAQVQLEAEMLELLAESFSDCSLDSLQVALAKSDWDLDRASAAVLAALQNVCELHPLGSKPCRHLLLGGECLRSDCAFSHDFATTTCKYWLQGQCANSSEGCSFRHDLDVPNENLASSSSHGLDEAAGDTMGLQVGGNAVDTVESTTPGRDGRGGACSSHPHICNDHRDGGHASLGMEDFPALESRTKVAPANGHSDDSSVTHDTAADRDAKPPVNGMVGWAGDRADLALPSAGGSLASWPESRFAQGSGGEALLTEKDESAGAGEEDVLLAALVPPTARKGVAKGKAGRKGGRGRKTRFTAVSLQALMKPTTHADMAAVAEEDEPAQPRARPQVGVAAAGYGQDAFPPPSCYPCPEAEVSDGPRGTRSSSSGGGGGSGGTETGGASFADVVLLSSPPKPPSTCVASTPKGGPPGMVGAESQEAWGVAGVRSGVGRGESGFVRNRSGAAGVAVVSRGEWVSTGDAVATQYEQARKEAAELARARNKLFTAATEAFRRGGQGMIARDLARRGRELNVRMKEKHGQAARVIFTSRNPGDQIFERRTMDLHGLHVSEATEVLDREMAALAARAVSSVRILTGSGHHSKGPYNKARLIPAVENYCRARGFRFTKVPDQGTGHIGALDLYFPELLEHEQQWVTQGGTPTTIGHAAGMFATREH